MIEIGNVLVHEDIINNDFVCNLNKCKGICCVEGDAGAPLTIEETQILPDIYKKVKPYLTEKGVQAIESQGTHVLDYDDEWSTTCVDKNKECAFVTWENGITKCGIEKAYEDGVVDWKKPISCHLYPIRVTKYPEFDVLYYDRWSICSDACVLGEELKVPVYKFLKDPLIRTYGEVWYNELEKVAKELKSQNSDFR